MVAVSQFVSDRALAACYSLAFASLISQAEVFSGMCGLNPSGLHILNVVLLCVGFLASVFSCLNTNHLKNRRVTFGALACLYVVGSFQLLQGSLLRLDYALVEVGLVVALGGAYSHGLTRLWLARMFFEFVMEKLVSCDMIGVAGAFLKFDSTNQPFPTATVWHVSNLPVWLVNIVGCMSIALATIAAFTLATNLKSSVGSLACLVATIAISVGGNFGWMPLLIASAAIRLLPCSWVQGFIGTTALTRWGCSATPSSTSQKSQSLIFAILQLLVGVSSITLLIHSGIVPSLPTASPVIVVVLFVIASILSLRRTPRSIPVFLVTVLANPSWIRSTLPLESLGIPQDTTGLCYTFDAAKYKTPVHSTKGRYGFLFQTKFTQIGTNTVGDNLGGVKYGELSLPGSVHGDETRPGFLLGHVPRLALRLWSMGTGNREQFISGMKLMKHLARVVETGSPAMRVFFPNAEESMLDALIASGKKSKRGNQVQSFYQEYQVTLRAADHQWWNRSHDNIAALPTKDVESDVRKVPTDCSGVLIPAKVAGVPIESGLITVFLALLFMKLLFSGGARPIKRKH